ncbi:hypothetical protein JXQ31_15210 [candidate division KSB1 bacterium]|nr:hypothetical protein [candidate division KSB1 bacterium]
MKKYFVTICCFFFSAFSYSGEPANESLVDKNSSGARYAQGSDVQNLDLNTGPRYKNDLFKPDKRTPDRVKENKVMPTDSLKYFLKKFHDQEHSDILRYRIDPNVDADMPRMALEPTVDAKIQKIYPHIGMDLLGLKKCPQKHHKFYFKK